MSPAAQGLLRTMCFHDACGYAPTVAEWVTGVDVSGSHLVSREEVFLAMDALVRDGTVSIRRGRVTRVGREELVVEHERREALFPKKWRAAKRVARWLSRINGVRFVALCNTAALLHAQETSDLDFFVITQRGMVWQTRLWGTLPFLLSRRRPSAHHPVEDAVCLSFFVDEASLDLSPLSLPGDDPYLRHWYLSLLPLYDDGVSQEFWAQNASLRSRHPLAERWRVPETGVRRPLWRVPTPRMLEPFARVMQERAFSPSIKQRMNRDTCVVVNGGTLKFHVDDGREVFRSAYEERCRSYGLAP